MAEPRTWLYAPGDRPERFTKAAASGAGAVLLDLEDGVAGRDKDLARAHVAEALRSTSAPVPRWVRANAGQRLDDDLQAVVGSGLAGICLPMVDDPSQVRHVADLLSALERARGLTPDSVPLMLLIETARGVLRALDCATASPRVRLLQLGEQDLRAELGLPGEDGGEVPEPLVFARAQVVLASAAAGLRPPVGPVTVGLRDADAVLTSTRRLRAGGFGGRAVIHPAQVAPVQQAFVPTDEEVERAREVVRGARTAAHGAVAVGGRMVDEPVVRQARAVLAAAGQDPDADEPSGG